MGKLINLPTSKGSSETYAFIPPDTVLSAAINQGLQDVIIIGWKDDELYTASSSSDIADLLLLIESAKKMIMK